MGDMGVFGIVFLAVGAYWLLAVLVRAPAARDDARAAAKRTVSGANNVLRSVLGTVAGQTSDFGPPPEDRFDDPSPNTLRIEQDEP